MKLGKHKVGSKTRQEVMAMSPTERKAYKAKMADKPAAASTPAPKKAVAKPAAASKPKAKPAARPKARPKASTGGGKASKPSTKTAAKKPAATPKATPKAKDTRTQGKRIRDGVKAFFSKSGPKGDRKEGRK